MSFSRAWLALAPWSEVPWVRYRSYLTRDELTKRFGKAKGGKVNLDFTPKGGTEKEQEHVPPDMFKKAIVDEYKRLHYPSDSD